VCRDEWHARFGGRVGETGWWEHQYRAPARPYFIGLDKPLRPMRHAADRFDVTMARISALARTDGIDLVLPVAWETAHPLDGPD